MKKSSGRNQLVLTIINLLVIGMIAAFFLARYTSYKNHFREMEKRNIYNSPLADVLIAEIDLLKQDRLYANGDGTYSYRGYVANNYVSYNGIIYRIVEISENGELILVTNEAITLSPLSQRDRFDKKPLYFWLNTTEEEHTGIFESTLNDKEDYLRSCISDFSTLEDIGNASRRQSGGNNYVALLSVYQYLNAGGEESYLYGDDPFWLSNVDGQGYSYYVTEEGKVEAARETNLMLGVRPLITLKAGLKVDKGKGTTSDPYLINENDPYQAKDIWVGSFVDYNDMLWRVTGKDDTGDIILTSTDIATRESGPVTIRQAHNNVYNVQTGAGYVFNHNYVKTMYRYEDFLNTRLWPIGGSVDGEYFDYRDNYQRSMGCWIYIPSTADMFLNDYQPCRLVTYVPYNQSSAYCIEDYHLKTINVTREGNYRICVCMEGTLMVADGFGTREEPYILEVDE